MKKIILLIMIAVSLSGCSPEVCVFEDGDSCEFKKLSSIDIKPDTKVFIYLSGSTPEDVPDPCYPEASNHGYGVPSMLKQATATLSKTEQVLLMAYCTPSKLGDYHADNLHGEPKILKRTNDILGLLAAFQDRDVNPNQIYLVGHSAGGWAALMAKQRAPEASKAAIALAPAFAGKTLMRSTEWVNLRARLAQDLAGSQRLEAYVLAFENDEFESTQTLSFLRKVKGVRFESMQIDQLRAYKCPHRPTHYLVHHDCVAPYADHIVRYVKRVK